MPFTSVDGDRSLEECISLQQQELEVLDSIYPECIYRGNMNGIVKLEIPVELPETATLIIDGPNDASPAHALSPETVSPQTASISTLPPVLLEILLPASYPFCSPEILSVHATHSWFPFTSALQRKLLEMWQTGEEILYTWLECIRTGEFLDMFELSSAASGERVIRIPHAAPHLLLPLLTAYDKSTQLKTFCQNSYECQICLSSIKGARCILLSCSHVFCRACLENFWKLCIAEGDIGRVGCPDPQCVKALSEANEEEVRRVVTDEEVRRWKWLREKRMVEKDPTVVHCPMSFCQHPVPKAPNVEEGSGWERLRTCPQCSYSFCSYCKRTWHGPHTDCPISVTETFVREYLALPEDSPERAVMERRYGAKNIRRLVERYEEERANERWLEHSTTECPTCNVHVEKSFGCNHMTCAKCREHFCYRCGERLQASNPYVHFSTPGKRCFSKLFDFENIDDEWQPMEGFDAI
ncbi:RWD-domain-containing protein [Obba rivulosa]|uniref:RBR-type E3 ubiquitin transferase n=1 Tax=Obba rivulosa TaxID=1052685 RepID=A0A8E2J7J7_9APHY|nr:RWD-domain-containing protein [Obba rivulosa]